MYDNSTKAKGKGRNESMLSTGSSTMHEEVRYYLKVDYGKLKMYTINPTP